MPRYQLACQYGIDKNDADLGVVVEIYPADRDLSVIQAGHPDCIVLPFDGETDDLERLGRFGPEPELLGDPPTALAPDHDELDAAGVPHTVVGDDGKQVTHPLRAMAGKVYPDNRQRDIDTRPYLAPRDWTADMLLAYAAQQRWSKEVGGVEVGKARYATDREAQSAIEKLGSRAARDAKFAPALKAADGSFQDVGNKGVIAVADAVSDHVAACFKAEAALQAAITAGKVKHRSDIDKAFTAL